MQKRLIATGGVLFAWLLVLVAEHLAVGLGYRDLIAGSWEMAMARTLVSPIALALLLPLAVVARALAGLVARAASPSAARRVLLGVGALGGAACGLGVTTGRHFAELPVRAAFVLGMALLAAVATNFVLLPFVAWGRRSPRPFAVCALVATAVLWNVDARILPHLYPWFHLAVFLAMLASAAPLGAHFVVGRAGRALGMAMVIFTVECALFTPHAARMLAGADNLRLVMAEHAPLMGRAVLFAAQIAPPRTDDEVTPGSLPGEIPRALDWSGRDVVLVTVDALRADHVGAYGYPRPTTPNLDALAAQGVTFGHAYCATPNTSYSIASLLTGKYMRPLLELGVGSDSETWPQHLRRYGYRTAAFYPPAVFFVDQALFSGFEARGFDFEYRKTQFATPEERAREVSDYLEKTKGDARPLFLWVHFFEPHEPYEPHPEHVFGEGKSDLDLYDGEIAAADVGIGAVVAKVRAVRPRALVIVTADHGEEFGEHGGRYHGTTVFEEQVRVPLVVSGEGIPHGRAEAPVETVDLLPTVLSALGIPRPARVRGRDLGPVFAGFGGVAHAPDDATKDGLAYVESDNYRMLARKNLRLVCERRVAACALYDLDRDPLERHDLSTERAADARALRALATEISGSHGQYEKGEAQKWPEALRRGMQGDVDAAEEVGALLDDARLDVRRRAAQVTFDLHAPSAAAYAKRALARDEDVDVRRFCALALVRMGEPAPPEAEAALVDATSVPWRRRAALAFAERGDARGGAELAAAWQAEGAKLSLEDARAWLSALARIREARAVPALVASLEDVRLRPFVADTLGAIGDPAARAPLLAELTDERFVTTRPHEVAALVALGARGELRAPLLRFAGTPEPLRDALRVARDLHLLGEAGWSSVDPVADVTVSLRAAPPEPDLDAGADAGLRVLVLTARPEAPVVTVGGASVAVTTLSDEEPSADAKADGGGRARGVLHVAELGALAPGPHAVHLTGEGGMLAAWLVRRTPEVPPPPPVPWDAGTDVDPGPRPQ